MHLQLKHLNIAWHLAEMCLAQRCNKKTRLLEDLHSLISSSHDGGWQFFFDYHILVILRATNIAPESECFEKSNTFFGGGWPILKSY